MSRTSADRPRTPMSDEPDAPLEILTETEQSGNKHLLSSRSPRPSPSKKARLNSPSPHATLSAPSRRAALGAFSSSLALIFSRESDLVQDQTQTKSSMVTRLASECPLQCVVDLCLHRLRAHQQQARFSFRLLAQHHRLMSRKQARVPQARKTLAAAAVRAATATAAAGTATCQSQCT